MDEVYAATLAEVRAARESNRDLAIIADFITWAETVLSYGQRVQPNVLGAHVARARSAVNALDNCERR